MPPLHPTLDKLKLIQQIQTGYEFAERTLALVPADAVGEAGVCGHWSVKNLIAHLTSWEQRTQSWLTEAEQGIPLTVPEAGFGWDQFDALNDVYYQRSKDRTLDDILAEWHHAQLEILSLVQGLTEDELAGSGRFTGMISDSPAHAIASNTCWHYDVHLAQIREWLNQRN
jgi:hypothetical protein